MGLRSTVRDQIQSDPDQVWSKRNCVKHSWINTDARPFDDDVENAIYRQVACIDRLVEEITHQSQDLGIVFRSSDPCAALKRRYKKYSNPKHWINFGHESNKLTRKLMLMIGELAVSRKRSIKTTSKRLVKTTPKRSKIHTGPRGGKYKLVGGRKVYV